MLKSLPPAPVAKTITTTDTRHGIAREDEYAWLRADNWQEVFQDPNLLDADIRAYLEAENEFQKTALADTEALQKTLFAEMRGRIKEDDASIPSPDGPFAYGTSFVTGGEQPRFFRIPRDGGDEEIMLDGDKEAEGKGYFRLSGANHAPDHSRILWGYDDKGSEFFSLRVRELTDGADHDARLENTGGGGAWSPDGKGFYYSLLDANHRPSKVYYHALGTDQKDDILVREESDAGFFMGVGGSRLNDFIFINVHDHQTSEYHLLPAGDPHATPQLVAARETGVEYDMHEGGDVFFILTNADGAKDFKIVEAPVDHPGRDYWRDVVAHEPGRLILSHTVFTSHLVWLEHRDGLPRIVIRDRTNGEEHAIAFDEEAYSLGLQGSLECDTEVIRFSYSSMTTPTQQFDYNMRTRERKLLKTQEVPSSHEPSNYVTRRVMASSHDGTLVPVSLLYRKGTPLDSNTPCLLYGYGAYGMTIPASFNTNCLSLVDRGFVYVIAHIRGGKDKGFAWYEAGKREQKVNTFLDFIAAADYLAAENFTSFDMIVAQGGSAGGMLMGAVANMAPDRFGAIIATVSFVDVLNTMLDDTLPLTPPEWPEWGNPIASKKDCETIATYSPYDNIGEQDYPPILAIAGLTDPCVTYWEPAKWVARLRATKTGDAPLLLKTNMEAGHAGASGRFQRLEEVAFEYAFALRVTGTAG